MAVITTEDFEKYLNNSNANDEVEIEWSLGTANVKRFVDFPTFIQISKSVADSCFGDDGNYNPEAKDPIFWSYIIDEYTDVELPDSLTARYDILLYTDIVEKIREVIDEEQIGALRDCIDKRIENIVAAGNNVLMKTIIEGIERNSDLSKAFTSGLISVKNIIENTNKDEKPKKVPKARKVER